MNISISEIMLVLLIALLVIKPEQLPEVAATLARLIKSLRQMFVKVKEDMQDFIDVDVVEKNHEQKRDP